MSDERPLAIWGPPCAGKSTLAARCADLLGWELRDLDQEIERRAGKPIAALFELGEAHFREFERNLAQELLTPRTVIALGGGTLLHAELRALYQQRARLVCVSATFETLLSRAEHSSARPLLQGDLKESLSALLQERQAAYGELTPHLETSGVSIEQAADALLQQAFPSTTLRARLGAREHDVSLGPGVLGALGRVLSSLGAKAPVFVLADRRAAAHHGARVKRALSAAGLQWRWVPLPPGEQQKSSERLWWVLRLLAREGADKGSFLVALGGGATCDLAALTASLYMRGINLVLAPTTALSIVDASLGGKTAINEWGVKNLLGTFYAPKVVVSDTTTLSSLPLRERRSALAEIVKIALLRDAELLRLLEENASRLITERADAHLWGEVMTRAAHRKLEVIHDDFEERGARRMLNLGHTLGHALEACADDLRHGEAIGLGLLASLHLSTARGLCDASLLPRVVALLSSLHLPLHAPKLPKEHLSRALKLDKKNQNGVLSFVVCREVGRAEVIHDVLKDGIFAAYGKLLS